MALLHFRVLTSGHQWDFQFFLFHIPACSAPHSCQYLTFFGKGKVFFLAMKVQLETE